ncbi:MAG: hybrid sensor histidine kinase/response regulator [Pseudomonadota bacterium]
MQLSFLQWVTLNIKRRLIAGTSLLLLVIIAIQGLYIVNQKKLQDAQFETITDFVASASRKHDLSTIEKASLLFLKASKGNWIALKDANNNVIWSYPVIAGKDHSGFSLTRKLQATIRTVSGPIYLVSKVPIFPNQLILIIILLTTVLFVAILFWAIKGVLKRLSTDLAGELKKIASNEQNIFIAEFEQARQRLCNLREKEKMHEKVLREKEKLAAIGQSAAMIAHDIRKPLTNMKSLLSMINGIVDNNDPVGQMATNVDNSINKVNSMLKEILDFSKKAIHLNLAEVDPVSIISSSLKEVFSCKHNLNINITYDLASTHNLMVDRDRVLRIFTNIVSNAVEAVQGKGDFWIKTEDVADKVRIVIGNDGPIISSEVQGKLFEPFFTTGKKQGTGLGLAICKKIIEFHKGSISVVSDNKNGKNKTEFIIDLPAAPHRTLQNSNELIYHSRQITSQIKDKIDYNKDIKKVIILNDDAGLLLSLKMMIKNNDTEVFEAKSVFQAQKYFLENKIDIILSDIDLGESEQTGYDFLKMIREKNTSIPFYMVSGYEQSIEEPKAVNLGATGYLQLPIEKAQLDELIQRS